MHTLHFIMDPQCSWCYAVAPLIDALSELTHIDIKTQGGGLFSGANKSAVSNEFRHHMLASDKKITALTGQVFSETYYAKVFANQQRVLDSDTPITALLAAESLGIKAVSMLHRMQTAQFIEGQSMSDIASLTNIAAELGIDTKDFLNAFDFFSGAKTNTHISHSRQLMRLLASSGFPTLAFEHPDGAFTKLDHQRYYNHTDQWLAYVNTIAKSIA